MHPQIFRTLSVAGKGGLTNTTFSCPSFVTESLTTRQALSYRDPKENLQVPNNVPLLATEPSVITATRENYSLDLRTPWAVKQVPWSSQKPKPEELSRLISSQNSELCEDDSKRETSGENYDSVSVETNFPSRCVRDTSAKEESLRRRQSLRSSGSRTFSQKKASEVVASGVNLELSLKRLATEADEGGKTNNENVTDVSDGSDVSIKKRSTNDVTGLAAQQEVKQAGMFFSSFDLTVDFSYVDVEQDVGYEVYKSPREDSSRYTLTYREEEALKSYRSTIKNSARGRHCKGTLVDKKTGNPIMSLSTLKRVLRRHQLMQSKSNLKETPRTRKPAKRRLKPQFSSAERDESEEFQNNRSVISPSTPRSRGEGSKMRKIKQDETKDLLPETMEVFDQDGKPEMTTQGDVFNQNELSPVSDSYNSVSLNRNLSSSDFLMKSTIADTNSLHHFNVTSSRRHLNTLSNSRHSVKDEGGSINPRNISHTSRGNPIKKTSETFMAEQLEDFSSLRGPRNSEIKREGQSYEITGKLMPKIQEPEKDRGKTRTLAQNLDNLLLRSSNSPKAEVESNSVSYTPLSMREKISPKNESLATFDVLDSRLDVPENNPTYSMHEIKAEHWWLNKRFQSNELDANQASEQNFESDASEENSAPFFFSERSDAAFNTPLIEPSENTFEPPVKKIEKTSSLPACKIDLNVSPNKSSRKLLRSKRSPKIPLRCYRYFGASGRYFNAILPRNQGKNVGNKIKIEKQSESPSQTDCNTESAGWNSCSTDSTFFKNRSIEKKSDKFKDLGMRKKYVNRYERHSPRKRFDNFNKPCRGENIKPHHFNSSSRKKCTCLRFLPKVIVNIIKELATTVDFQVPSQR